MYLDLKGKVAIVTGGSKGIGRSIALALANEGVNVVICARDPVALRDVEKESDKLSGKVITVSADVTDASAVLNVVNTAVKHFGRLDILVNNVGGIDKFAGFLDLEDDEWTSAFQLNVMSVVYFVRNALPHLRKSRSPRIINISSISGLEPGLYNPHYTIVKAAVINLGKYLANHFANEGILINTICAGPVYSSSWDKNVQSMAKTQGIPFDEAKIKMDEAEIKKIPLGRIGTGEDIAPLAAFLASDNASWITGSCFTVDGGKARSIS